MPDGPRELRVVVTASDYDAAVAFYRDVLGLGQRAAFAAEGGRVTILEAGRATLEITDPAHAAYIDEVEVGRRVAGHVRVAFEVSDTPAVTDALVAAGARLVADPVRTPWDSLNARLDGPGDLHLTVYTPDVYLRPRARLDSRVHLAEPDPTWPATGTRLVSGICEALGAAALVVEHAGSTSVPDLPAKPVIDLLLGVADPADEDAYVPALEGAGYRLELREPDWHEHRLLKPGPDVVGHDEVNLHVFAVGSEEIDRMLAFRDHLRTDRRDRELYRDTKQELASRTWAFIQDYADAKSDVVADIMSRASTGPASMAGTFVLVSGPPASGKTTLARDLAPRLMLPLLAKDTLKQALMSELEVPDLTASRVLGRASAAALLALAAHSGGAVLEGPWNRGRAAAIGELPGPVVEVFCRVERETAVRRFRARAVSRQPGHFDSDRTDEELWSDEVTEPVAGGWPVLEVDTTVALDIERVARIVRQRARY